MKCCAKLRGVFAGSCAREGKYIRDNKPYCWTHDPERQRAVAHEKWEKRKLEIKRMEADYDTRIARHKLLEEAGLANPSNELLKRIIAHGGIESLLTRFEE